MKKTTITTFTFFFSIIFHPEATENDTGMIQNMRNIRLKAFELIPIL